MFEYVIVVSHLSNAVKWNNEKDDIESMLIARERGGKITSYVDFLKFAM